MVVQRLNALLLCCILTLAGCSIYNIGDAPGSVEHRVIHEYPSHQSKIMVVVIKENSGEVEYIDGGCEVFTMPSYDPLPSVPVIPEAMRTDYMSISNRLLDHIIVLNNHTTEQWEQVQAAYQKYLQECQG